MKKIITILFLLMFPIKVNASSSAYLIMDADSGRVLKSYNSNERMLIASTTKIMTAIVAIENANIYEEYIVGDEIDEVYGSMLYLKKGEILSLENLLYGLMLRSGNDAAMVIASNIGGYDSFINLMNKKALALGMKSTTFENPHGLDEDTKNYSTAYDMAILMKYATNNQIFSRISGTKKYKISTNITTHIWYNKNSLLTMYKYATGGKIGYTKTSRHIFVSSATKDDKNLIAVSFKDTDRFGNHKNLYETTFNEYNKYQILNKYTFLIDEPHYKKYYLYIKNDFYMLLKKTEIKNLELKIKLVKNKKIKGETRVGEVVVMLKENVIHRENIYAIEETSKINRIKALLFFWNK